MAIKNRLVNRVFNDLDAYRDFCREFGRIFDEKHLYDRKTSWGDFEYWRRPGNQNKAWNQWMKDARDFNNRQR